MVNGQMEEKLTEINKETDKYTEENKKLKNEIESENAKFGNGPDITKDFNKKFVKAKKEYERATREYIQVHKKMKN